MTFIEKINSNDYKKFSSPTDFLEILLDQHKNYLPINK